MDIEFSQTIKFENVLSYRFSSELNVVSERIKEFETIIDKYKFDKIGNVFTGTYKSYVNDKNKVIVDMELMVPVNKRIKLIEDKFKIKDEFLLTNAMKVTFVGKDVQDALPAINNYIISNELFPITPTYVMMTKQINNNEFEYLIYIGLNPNKL